MGLHEGFRAGVLDVVDRVSFLSTAVVNSEWVSGREYYCSVTSTLLQECTLGGLLFTWVVAPKLNGVE